MSTKTLVNVEVKEIETKTYSTEWTCDNEACGKVEILKNAVADLAEDSAWISLFWRAPSQWTNGERYFARRHSVACSVACLYAVVEVIQQARAAVDQSKGIV